VFSNKGVIMVSTLLIVYGIITIIEFLLCNSKMSNLHKTLQHLKNIPNSPRIDKLTATTQIELKLAKLNTILSPLFWPLVLIYQLSLLLLWLTVRAPVHIYSFFKNFLHQLFGKE
jgi:hypothetical protein